ncbi:MAG: hypothetical protein MRZ61_09790 [Oscillospiraceae bacterium]|nr:hypothetical protein [Oscillospiraceae bacterium]
MKKMILAVCAALLLCGCTKVTEPNYNVISSEAEEKTLAVETDTSKIETTEETEAETSAVDTVTSDTADVTEEETDAVENYDNIIGEDDLHDLFEENINCFVHIFGISNLGYTGNPVQGDNIYSVSNDMFTDYADFESYVRSVYCTAEADRLLYDYPYEDSPMYMNVDGELCIDINLAGAKGYYVDWTDCVITINSADENRCEFTATGYIEEPAEVPVKEDYPVSGAAVLENGKWVLEKMMY